MNRALNPVAFVLTAMALFVFVDAANAGRNRHGQLIIHARPNWDYSSVDSPAGYAELDECDLTVSEVSPAETPLIWYVLASFPEGIEPRVTAVEFGIQYDEDLLSISEFGFSNYRASYRTADWPAPGSSVLVHTDEPRTVRLFEVGWFVGFQRSQAQSAYFEISHPKTTAATFWNVHRPDEVEWFGTLGFGQAGTILCDPEVQGGCCLGDDSPCVQMTLPVCREMGGVFMGLDELCEPNSCSMGLCCRQEFGCDLVLAFECRQDGGDPIPGEMDLDMCANYCVRPVVVQSWGSVKSHFRGSTSR